MNGIGEPSRQWSRAQAAVLLVMVAVGVLVDVAYVGRPLDHRLFNPWRQADYYQITRNFYREGTSILYPQVDWRGDTPGYVEMELPVLPWVGGRLFAIFGLHAQILRGISAALSIAGLALFVLLARKILPPSGAVLAVGLFALNPLLVLLATSIQPEPLMHLLVLASALLLCTWWDRPSAGLLFAAAACEGAAILCKASAAYFGLVIGYFVLRKLGVRALAKPHVYVAGLAAVLPAVLWYTWAHRFWTMYGLSLGMSDESHWIGLDLLLPPWFLVGVARWEVLAVFSPVGVVLALAALGKARRSLEFPLVWYAAAVVFYVAAARSSGDHWAHYYHLLSVAPAALLMGGGWVALTRGRAFGAAVARLKLNPRWVGVVLAGAAVGAMAAVTTASVYRRDYERDYYRVMRECSLELAQHIPPSGLIVVRGGRMHDETGHPVAYHESMIFAWIDRKGFNYGQEELDLATLEGIAARGGRYWIMQPDEIADGELRRRVTSHYHRIAQCREGYALFDLQSAGVATPHG